MSKKRQKIEVHDWRDDILPEDDKLTWTIPPGAHLPWGPKTEALVTISGLTQGMLREALLASIGPRTGRPKGTGTFESREDFVATMLAAMSARVAEGHEPTQAALAEYLTKDLGVLCEDGRQVRRWCKSWKVQWSELKRRAMAQGG